MAKVIIFLLLIVSILTVGCAGVLRTPDKVDAYQYGDDSKSCKELELALESCKLDYEQSKRDRDGKILGNVIKGASAFILPVMLLTLDISDTDVDNIETYRKRYEMLTKICMGKKCDFDIIPLAVTKPKPHTVTR